MLERITSIIVVLLALVGPAMAQGDFSSVEITSQHVAGNVYMLQGSGGNIGVSVGADGVLIVDDQFAPLAGKIRGALKELSPGKLKFILNTHFHGDHTGGNVEFGPEAPIIAQTNVRKRLMGGQGLPGPTDAVPDEAWPVITFDESLSVHFNGEEIQVAHLPHGHTDGDSIIRFTESNVIHMGDDFFNGGFPFVDIEHGGDVAGLTRNIAHVLETLPADVRIIPGHGNVASPGDLRAYHRMLIETTEIVRKQMLSGRGLEAIKEAGLSEEWRSWGTGFISTDRWLETIYRCLVR
jgi:glyoxylase-like metal-dependent hydrolase (beta-lactamase superfamily II)